MSVAAWEAIKTASDEIGWPANWNTDLDIDRRTLTTTIHGPPPTRFIFILRENGTHICRSGSEAESVAKVWKWANLHFFFWDGQDLTKHDSVEACILYWVNSLRK